MEDREKYLLQKCNEACRNTLMETLGIEFVEIGTDYVVAKMPVGPKVHQPDGVLHGGAMVALAESVGSMASFVLMDNEQYFVRGIEISANHVKSLRSGEVFARAEPLHMGRTTQVWQIRLTNEDGRLVSFCKLTTISLPKQ